MSLLALLPLLPLLLACGESDAPAPAAAPVAAPTAAPVAAAAPAPDPLAGKSKREICEDNGLALIQWDFETLKADFRGNCCGADGIQDDPICELDWPFSDVPPCSAYDAMRNHIYARYGYDFNDPTWEQEFEKREWYSQRKDFEAKWLSPTAQKNIEKLKQLKKDKVACEG